MLVFCTPSLCQDIALQTASGGVTISGSGPFTSGFGNVNGLGAGTTPTGLTLVTSGVSGGVLYTTPYNIRISGASTSHPAAVSIYMSTNFGHPSNLILKSCYPSSSCTSAASYGAVSTSSASPTPVISAPGLNNSTVTASFALFVSNTSGTGFFSGTDTAAVTFLVYDASNMSLKHTYVLNLTSPATNVQTAVRLTLGTASGGVTISPASDYSMSYGNVNGLGIGPSSGLTVVSASGGVIYTTPYLLQPSFSSFSTSTATLKAYVSLDFVHPAIVEMRNASSSGGPYAAISKSSGSQTSLTATAASGTAVTRYLGLFVANTNGASAFTGADNARLTYTLTAP